MAAPPHAIVGRQSAISSRQVTATPGGRFVVYGGQLLVDDERFDQSFDFVTAVHDLAHPLSWVNRPPATFSPADVQALSALLDDAPARPLADDERQVLELVRDAAAYHRDAQATSGAP
jgi:hypothetical protein